MIHDEIDDAKNAIIDTAEEFLEFLGATIFPVEDDPNGGYTVETAAILLEADFRLECNEMLDEILGAIDQLRHRELIVSTIRRAQKAKG